VRTAAKPEPLRPPAFSYRSWAGRNARPTRTGSELFCEAVSLEALAKRYRTPLYVYSAEMIRARIRAFQHAFRTVPHTLCYSVKANSTLGILRLIARQGAGFDVVSGGELQRVLRVAPRAARNVVFSGVGKTVQEMKLALQAGILLFNIESASELRTLAETSARLKKPAQIALRVNPDVSANTHPYISTGLHEHKFGVPIPEALKLYREAVGSPRLKVAGVSVHIGSQITAIASFQEALERVADLVRDLRQHGHEIRYVDAGGGLGISYEGPQEQFVEQISAYADAVLKPLRGLDVHLLLEPGRSIVGPAGVLLTRVIYRKTNDHKRFLIVDAAMNDLLRPSLYSAYHEIVPVRLARSECNVETRLAASPVAPDNPTEVTDVVGPICETGDFFARDRELPVVNEGGLLAILDAGAYGAVLSSNYNTRGRPAEVLVDGRRSRAIRRRETVTDQLKMEAS
jgi:diaminopimelate decarboxylase